MNHNGSNNVNRKKILFASFCPINLEEWIHNQPGKAILGTCYKWFSDSILKTIGVKPSVRPAADSNWLIVNYN